MVTDVERMQVMIGEVLIFAREAVAPPEVLDVRPLLAAIIEGMIPDDPMVRLLPSDEAQVRAPELAFRRAVENLLRDAVDYAGGGTIDVQQADTDVVILVVILVADGGPGIPGADRERLLRPFECGEAPRNRDTGGAGLGLSIVRDFATRHRGDFALSDGRGGGTIATLQLPAA